MRSASKTTYRSGKPQRPPPTIKRRRQPEREFPLRDPFTRQAFDHDSGQVFQETEVVFNKRPTADWISEYRTPSLVKRHRPGGSGARSLFDMAQAKCGMQIKDLGPEHFDHVPWSIASRLWMDIKIRHAETFHTWRTLASAYGGRDEFARREDRYSMKIRQPSLQLREYFNGLCSDDHRWLVALRISPKQTTIPDLVAISSIVNLAVLDLSDGQLVFDDRSSVLDERIFRTWAELARAGRAFACLRTIMFGWQDSLSDWMFKYLSSFPSLDLVIVTDCRNLHQKNRAQWESTALEHGWQAQHAKRSAKTLRPLLDDKEFDIGTTTNCYYQNSSSSSSTIITSPDSEQLENSGDDEDEDQPQQQDEREHRPLLECTLGTPRLWTHIIDEFPGARTIWLERSDGTDNPRSTTEEPPPPPPQQQKQPQRIHKSATEIHTDRNIRNRGKSNKRRAPVRDVRSLLAEFDA